MLPIESKPGFTPPNESLSTGDFIASFSRYVTKDMDLLTPTSKEKILARAEYLKASEISDTGKVLTEAYPGIDTLFARTFIDALQKISARSPGINAAHLLQAYEVAVEIVRNQTTKQFSHLMLMPLAVSEFLDFFGAPISQELVADLEKENSTLAETYQRRNQSWTEGSSATKNSL